MTPTAIAVFLVSVAIVTCISRRLAHHFVKPPYGSAEDKKAAEVIHRFAQSLFLLAA